MLPIPLNLPNLHNLSTSYLPPPSSHILSSTLFFFYLTSEMKEICLLTTFPFQPFRSRWEFINSNPAPQNETIRAAAKLEEVASGFFLILFTIHIMISKNLFTGCSRIFFFNSQHPRKRSLGKLTLIRCPFPVQPIEAQHWRGRGCKVFFGKKHIFPDHPVLHSPVNLLIPTLNHRLNLLQFTEHINQS